MSLVKLSKVPEGLEGSAGFLGKKWLEAVREMFGILSDTQENGIVATGITQNAAYLLSSSISVIVSAAAGVNDSVKMPPITNLKKFPRMLFNASGATIQVFPNTGENFYGTAADTAVNMATGDVWIFWPISDLAWVIKI